MRVLLDECVNPRLRQAFQEHEVTTVAEANWLTLPESELLNLAKGNFDVFITIDTGFAYQHNLRKLTFGIVIVHVPANTLEFYQPIFDQIRHAAEMVKAGQVIHVPFATD